MYTGASRKGNLRGMISPEVTDFSPDQNIMKFSAALAAYFLVANAVPLITKQGRLGRKNIGLEIHSKSQDVGDNSRDLYPKSAFSYDGLICKDYTGKPLTEVPQECIYNVVCARGMVTWTTESCFESDFDPKNQLTIKDLNTLELHCVQEAVCDFSELIESSYPGDEAIHLLVDEGDNETVGGYVETILPPENVEESLGEDRKASSGGLTSYSGKNYQESSSGGGTIPLTKSTQQFPAQDCDSCRGEIVPEDTLGASTAQWEENTQEGLPSRYQEVFAESSQEVSLGGIRTNSAGSVNVVSL